MTAALEDVKAISIEEWDSLDTAASPTKLKQGQTPNANNTWVDEKPGSVVTAPGYRKVGSIPSGLPVTFEIDFFKTSTGEEIFVVSDNQNVYTTIDFQAWTTIIIGLSASFQLRGMVIRDKLWLTNGSDAVRTFNGTTVAVLNGTAGTPNVPKGKFISYHDERVWMYHTPTDRSATFFSALTDSAGAIIEPDSANAWPSDNQLQVSEGDADFGTGLLLYRGYLHFFKQYSIWRLVGYDEYTYARVKTRASTGTRFNESVQILDSLVELIGTDGLYTFDGEETVRISDLIDPSAASQTAFGFNELQQPNTNNRFWESSLSADWNSGTVPTNILVNNSLALKASDDSAADFAAGTPSSFIDLVSNPGNVQLAHGTSGVSSENIAAGKVAAYPSTFQVNQVGLPAFLTDSNLTQNTGFRANVTPGSFIATINLGVLTTISRIVIKSWLGPIGVLVTLQDTLGTYFDIVAISNGVLFPIVGVPGKHGAELPATTTPLDITIDIAPLPDTILGINFNQIPNGGFATMTEIEVYASAFRLGGRFVSKTLDYGLIPSASGSFNAESTIPAGTGITYFTQSSADGITWDAEVACTDGGAIGSTLRRYLRWGADFTSTGLNTPVIASVWIPALYLSPIHNTGGSIFAWGPFQADYGPAGQQFRFYYRTAASLGGVLAASWNLIVPPSVVNSPVAQQFIQFKIEMLNGDATHVPTVLSLTVNWVVGSGTQAQTLQNVASAVWHNRYWLAAARAGSTANNVILIRGKKTFNSPWQLKDWGILSFTKFHDSFYGGSSLDGSIYNLDVGFSKDGAALDSYFETGDFTFAGFMVSLNEIIIEVERLGPYNLSVGVSTDQGETWTEKNVDLTVSTYANNYTKKLNFDIFSERFRIRVRTNGADQPFQVHRLIAYYVLTNSRGSIR